MANQYLTKYLHNTALVLISNIEFLFGVYHLRIDNNYMHVYYFTIFTVLDRLRKSKQVTINFKILKALLRSVVGATPASK